MKIKKSTNTKGSAANREIVRTPKDIGVKDLNHAPWNPRPRIEKKDVAELAASIDAGGLIHRIGVWKNEKGKFVVIDGNRRLEALKSIGMKTAPCDVLEIDETAAREMTITANLQRTDSDPFMMADNIQQLRDRGRTIEEIAAALGKGVNWVWRRLQLTNIADCWKKAHLSGEVTFTLDALEKISRYSKELQEHVYKGSQYYFEHDGETSWYKIKREFESHENNLATVPFDKSECLKCTNNTATQPMLFDLGEENRIDRKGGICGKCTNMECFMRKYAEHTKAEKKRIEAETGEKIKVIKYAWNIPGDRTERKTKKNTTPYLVKEDDVEKIYWGEKSEQEQMPAKTDEERAAEKEEKRLKKIQNGACKKVQAWAEKNLEAAIKGIVNGGPEMDILATTISDALIADLHGYDDKRNSVILWKTLMTDVSDMTGDEMAALTQMWLVIEKTHKEEDAMELQMNEEEEKNDGSDECDI